jgi:hypothetical protein
MVHTIMSDLATFSSEEKCDRFGVSDTIRERSSSMKNRKREICTSGSVRLPLLERSRAPDCSSGAGGGARCDGGAKLIGMMAVAAASYRSGPSRDWIKVKNPDSPAMVARTGQHRSRQHGALPSRARTIAP